MRVGRRQTIGRRAAAGLTSATVAVSLAACGSTSTPAGASGKQIFASSGCGGCHTLAAAKATGSVGPNLDQLKPSYAAVVSQVTNGGGVMPSFSGSLSTSQIATVARFVVSATR